MSRWQPGFEVLAMEEWDVLRGDVPPTRSPYTRLEAWLDLKRRASSKARDVEYDGCSIHLERGQLILPRREAIERWGWRNKSAVDRFFAQLRQLGWIDLNQRTSQETNQRTGQRVGRMEWITSQLRCALKSTCAMPDWGSITITS